MVKPAYIQGSGVIGVGWPWPPTGPVFQTGLDLIESKIGLVVATFVGTHKMEPGFGSDVISLVFESILLLESLASISIRNALAQWLPEVEIRDVRATEDPLLQGSVLVEIDYIYLGQEQSLGVTLGGSPGV